MISMAVGQRQIYMPVKKNDNTQRQRSAVPVVRNKSVNDSGVAFKGLLDGFIKAMSGGNNSLDWARRLKIEKKMKECPIEEKKELSGILDDMPDLDGIDGIKNITKYLKD